MFSKVDGDSMEYWLLFKGNKILISEDKVLEFTLPEIDFFKLSKKLVRSQFLGQVEGRSYYAAELTPEIVAPENMLFCDLYRLLGKIPDALFFLAGKAYQILHWDRTHQYCSQCGARTENKIDEKAKLCPSCGLVNYPRISPAIIVAITRDREILLAKGSRFQADFYSVLAGFVEPGETFEECVQREVREEVGLEVKNIRYFSSQPWPFPDSLMVGFTAEYAGGNINIDENEILNAGWFDVDQLPLIPRTGSIARSLIDWFIEQVKSEETSST
ncbi:Zn-finger containing NTP pyrophosphohydrolase [Desulfosporosinus orientis DSM 765]|uniref:NAD-capped RNA hydrolase NudC n=1 Tax=Desulfosporosinus orientis (strain ATCC 19365 / DSM 765 / NCIMB 8382 / VKM B-1628 / Singapore I) TaxID=768706 RepID=G7WGF6_DESOD|nr:NAD(+) diphosphatase [Desulfosporosinus orientis]AET68033.1 Zn-finger containing NTP pyrophosphohydrolase [Desulfosporosinus orientis DSM 765]